MLSGLEIQQAVESGRIEISPFSKDQVNPNSYNLRLSNQLLVYDFTKIPSVDVFYSDSGDRVHYRPLDMRKENPVRKMTIEETGFLLVPGTLYLGSTVERTKCSDLVPIIEGRSSIGRLGLCVHVTAGFGDCGFDGRWTLELTVVHPLIVYPNVKICQIAFTPIIGQYIPYQGKYQNQTEPQPSRLWKDFEQENS